jgi:hypothetical protein
VLATGNKIRITHVMCEALKHAFPVGNQFIKENAIHHHGKMTTKVQFRDVLLFAKMQDHIILFS